MRAALANRNDWLDDFHESVIGVDVIPHQDQLAVKLNVFLALAAGLALDVAEQRTMLDISTRDLQRLCQDISAATSIGAAKLRRRLDYAIPVLSRMLASAAS